VSVTRINQFQAREGQGAVLRAIVASFLPAIRSAAGNLGCRLLQGEDDPDRVVVIEEWESVPDHRAAVEGIPADALAKAKELLAGPPQGGYFRE